MKNEYTIPDGHRAVISEDGRTVTIEPKPFDVPPKGTKYWSLSEIGKAEWRIQKNRARDKRRAACNNVYLTYAECEAAVFPHSLFHRAIHQHGAGAVREALEGIGQERVTAPPAVRMDEPREVVWRDGMPYLVLRKGESTVRESIMRSRDRDEEPWSRIFLQIASVRHSDMCLYANPITLTDEEMALARSGGSGRMRADVKLRERIPRLSMDDGRAIIDALCPPTYHDGTEIGDDDRVWCETTEDAGLYGPFAASDVLLDPGIFLAPYFRTRAELQAYQKAEREARELQEWRDGLKNGDPYWMACRGGTAVRYHWANDASDMRFLREGRIYPTREQAEQHVWEGGE